MSLKNWTSWTDSPQTSDQKAVLVLFPHSKASDSLSLALSKAREYSWRAAIESRYPFPRFRHSQCDFEDVARISSTAVSSLVFGFRHWNQRILRFIPTFLCLWFGCSFISSSELLSFASASGFTQRKSDRGLFSTEGLKTGLSLVLFM